MKVKCTDFALVLATTLYVHAHQNKNTLQKVKNVCLLVFALELNILLDSI